MVRGKVQKNSSEQFFPVFTGVIDKAALYLSVLGRISSGVAAHELRAPANGR